MQILWFHLGLSWEQAVNCLRALKSVLDSVHWNTWKEVVTPLYGFWTSAAFFCCTKAQLELFVTLSIIFYVIQVGFALLLESVSPDLSHYMQCSGAATGMFSSWRSMALVSKNKFLNWSSFETWILTYLEFYE